MTGTEWEVVSVAKLTDGDTLRLIRRRLIDELDYTQEQLA